MLKKFMKVQLNDNQMFLHEKKVDIPKLTPEKWKRLFEKVDMLPGLILQVVIAPKGDLYQTVISAFEIALDELTEIVAILTDLDPDYIHRNVGIDELIEFFTRTVERNRLDDASKNLKSLLPGTNQRQKAQMDE